MKRTTTMLVIALAMAAYAFAQSAAKPDASLPSVDQVLDKYVQALGGKSNIEKQTSRLNKGTLEIPAFGASGTFETYEQAPNKSSATIDITGFGTIREGYDGKVAWSQDPQSGLREKSGLELAATKLENEFHRNIKLKQLYPKIIVKGKEKVGENDAIVLEATPTEGAVEQWYFDAASGLLVRQDAERETPQGKMAIQTFFDSYREVDGVKIPVVVRQVSPVFTVNMKTDEIKHNIQVDPTKFAKPAA